MFGSLLSTFAATMFAMQAASAPAPFSATARDANTAVTASGCASRNTAAPGAFTFAETGTGAKYEAGAVVRKSAGRSPTIRGGLYPSPNVAAQSGALDPAQVAIASLPGGTNSGTGTVELPEIRMTRVRALDGSCQ